MALEWVQQYEDGGRLINKYVDTDTGQEHFEDAGPVQQAAPPPNDGYGPTQQVSEADYMQAHQGFNPYASNATAAGIPSAYVTPPQSNPYRPDAPGNPTGPTVGPGGQVQTGENWVYDVDAEGYEVRRDPSRGIPNQRTGRMVGRQNAQVSGTPTDASEAEYWQNRAKMEQADQASNLVYRDWMMRTGNDKLAFEKATQAWNQKMAERQQDFSEQQAGRQEQARQDQTGLAVLGMNANLRGPSNYLSYLRTLSNTPRGLSDAVAGLAGRFNLSSQQSSVPGATYERQSVATIARDLGQAAAGAPGANDASGVDLPGGNQWNARNFGILARNPTQLGLLQNLYEESGRDWQTEYGQFLSSLPRFGGARGAQLVMR